MFILLGQMINNFNHSHKKRKDSLEGSLDWALFTAELEFSKILVHRLPQHTSNVNIEYGRKSELSKQVYSLYATSFLEHWYILILFFWVLFATKLEFLKILVHSLPQHTSNVNIECVGKSELSKQRYSLYATSFLEHWYILILLFWY